MLTVETKTIGECWIEAMRSVLLYGEESHDEDVTLKEVLGLSVKVESPEMNDHIVACFGDPNVVKHTLKKFEKGVVMNNRPFTYGACIYNKNGVDQFEWMVDRLTKKRESKSATISLLTEGTLAANLPCLSMLDAKIRNDKLNIQFFFRSQNIAGRQYANLLAITKLQYELASRLGVGVGFLSGYIASAHIYEYDFPKVAAICNNEKVVIDDQFYVYGPRSIRENDNFK